jgi:hypothetical protein
MDLKIKINLIQDAELKNWALKKVCELAADYGQSINNDDANHIAAKFYREMRSKGDWRLVEFESIIDLGLKGMFKNSINTSKITVAKLLGWIGEYSNMRSQKVVADTVQESKELNNKSEYNDIMGSIIAQLYLLGCGKYRSEVEQTRGFVNSKGTVVNSHLLVIRDHVNRGGTVESYLEQLRTDE